MVVHELQKDTLSCFEEIIKNRRIVVVEASSIQDEKSKLVSREVNDLSEKYKLAHFVRLDKHRNSIVTGSFGTSSWPTFYVYRDEIEIHEIKDMDTKRLDEVIRIALRSITPASPEAVGSCGSTSGAEREPCGLVFQNIGYMSQTPRAPEMSVMIKRKFHFDTESGILSPKSQENKSGSAGLENSINSAMQDVALQTPTSGFRRSPALTGQAHPTNNLEDDVSPRTQAFGA